MKKGIWLWIIILILAVVGVVGYSRLSESKKRYLGYISRQAPDLIARYFV